MDSTRVAHSLPHEVVSWLASVPGINVDEGGLTDNAYCIPV